VDLRQIVQPVYAVGTEDDHIAPWQQTFKLMRHVRGPRRYVLSSSGHILGIVNPPKNPPKRKYWVSDLTDSVPRADSWLKSASEHPNSWWEDWVAWLRPQAGELVAPKDPASVPSLGKAPGSYVLER
jgi:polyhydroxyalkanoate synthase